MRAATIFALILAAILIAPAAARCAEEKTGSAGKEPSDETLHIGPRQDRDLIKKAWQTQVKVDYHNTDVPAVLADLAKQSGIPIEVLPDGRAILANANVSRRGNISFYTIPGFKVQGMAFLGRKGYLQTLALRAELQVTPGRVEAFRCSETAPLIYVLSGLLNAHGLDCSFRKDGIAVSSLSTLYDERAVTCRFNLAYDWGTLYRTNFNGTDYVYRLDLLDSVAYRILENQTEVTLSLAHPGDRFYQGNGDPTGAFQRMLDLKFRPIVEYDKAAKTLSVTAHPSTMDYVKGMVDYELTHALPEEVAAQAKEFKSARIERDGIAAWDKLDAGRRAELERLSRALNDDSPAARDDAERKLKEAGLAAVVALGNLSDPKRILEVRERGTRVVDAAYKAALTAEIRARAEAYLMTAQGGDLASIRANFWTSKRNQEFDAEAQEFDQTLAAVKDDPAALKIFRDSHGFPADTPVGKMSLQNEFCRKYQVRDAKIEGITFAGPKAVVSFTMVLPEGHPVLVSVQDFLKDLGIDRPVETFTLIHEGEQWMAGGDEHLAESEKLIWSRKAEIPRSEGSQVESTVEEDTGGVGVSASISTGVFAYQLGLRF